MIYELSWNKCWNISYFYHPLVISNITKIKYTINNHFRP